MFDSMHSSCRTSCQLIADPCVLLWLLLCGTPFPPCVCVWRGKDLENAALEQVETIADSERITLLTRLHACAGAAVAHQLAFRPVKDIESRIKATDRERAHTKSFNRRLGLDEPGNDRPVARRRAKEMEALRLGRRNRRSMAQATV